MIFLCQRPDRQAWTFILQKYSFNKQMLSAHKIIHKRRKLIHCNYPYWKMNFQYFHNEIVENLNQVKVIHKGDEYSEILHSLWISTIVTIFHKNVVPLLGFQRSKRNSCNFVFFVWFLVWLSFPASINESKLFVSCNRLLFEKLRKRVEAFKFNWHDF